MKIENIKFSDGIHNDWRVTHISAEKLAQLFIKTSKGRSILIWSRPFQTNNKMERISSAYKKFTYFFRPLIVFKYYSRTLFKRAIFSSVCVREFVIDVILCFSVFWKEVIRIRSVVVSERFLDQGIFFNNFRLEVHQIFEILWSVKNFANFKLLSFVGSLIIWNFMQLKNISPNR